MLTSVLYPMKVKDVAIDRINSELLLLILMGELFISTQRQKYEANLNFNINIGKSPSTSYLL